MRLGMIAAIFMAPGVAFADGCESYRDQLDASVALGSAAIEASNKLMVMPLLEGLSDAESAKVLEIRDKLMAEVSRFNDRTEAVQEAEDFEC